MIQVTIPTERIDAIITSSGSRREALIDILLNIQEEARYLPRPALDRLCDQLQVPVGEIYHIATFYKAFSLEPKGKYVVQVCLGTTCHVRGGPLLVDRMTHELGIKAGETTSDGLITLETVGCVGTCALAPVVAVNGEVHGNMTQPKLIRSAKKWQ